MAETYARSLPAGRSLHYIGDEWVRRVEVFGTTTRLGPVYVVGRKSYVEL